MAWLLLAVCASCKVLNVLCGLIAWRMYEYKRRETNFHEEPNTNWLFIGGSGSGVGPSDDIVLEKLDAEANDLQW